MFKYKILIDIIIHEVIIPTSFNDFTAANPLLSSRAVKYTSPEKSRHNPFTIAYPIPVLLPVTYPAVNNYAY